MSPCVSINVALLLALFAYCCDGDYHLFGDTAGEMRYYIYLQAATEGFAQTRRSPAQQRPGTATYFFCGARNRDDADPL